MASELRDRLLLAMIYTVAFAVLATSSLRQYGFSLDDSYIYQSVARSLATGEPAFYPGQRGAGATSLLWVYLQAADYRFFHGFDPILYNLALNWITLVLIGQLLFSIAQHDGVSPSTRWILAASPAVCGNFLWLGMIGMEHLLFVALSLAAIYFWFDAVVDRRSNTAVYTGLAIGLLAITRPEAMLLGPLLVLLVARQVGRTGRDVIIALNLWSVGVASYFGWTWHNFHSLMPTTLKGRSWLWFRNSHGPHSAQAIGDFFIQELQLLPRLFSAHFSIAQVRLGYGQLTFTFLVIFILALAVTGLWALLAQKPLRITVLLAWAAIHAGTYLVALPAIGHGGRYQPLFLLLAFPVIFLGLLSTVKRIHPLSQSWQLKVGVLLFVFAGTSSLLGWRMVTIRSCEHINGTHGRMARWMVEHLPSNATIACFDIGRISYDLERPITDLGGLADSSYMAYLASGRVAEYLENNGVQYVVLPEMEGADLGLLGGARSKSTEVIEFCTSNEHWELSFIYTANAWQCQRLYRLIS